MFLLNKLVGLCLTVFLSAALANEAKKPEAAAAEPTEDKDQQERTKEWMDLGSQISALKTKIKSKEDNIKEIIKHKHHAATKAEAEHAVSNLLKEHAELKKLEEEYNEKTQLLKYRYPDVGITEKRKYERIKIKSIEDYEQIMTLESQVKKSVIKVKEHYGIKDMEEDGVEKSKPNEATDEPNNLIQPKILRK